MKSGPSELRAAIAGRAGARPLLLDGGLGTELLKLGAKAPALELLNATQPDLVARTHTRFLAAGCDLITTNTFCAQRSRLAEFGLGERVVELNQRGAELARITADLASSAGRKRWVLGSMGPGRFHNPDDLEFDPHRVLAEYREQAGALLNAGVDGLLIETATHVDVAGLALEAAHGAQAASAASAANCPVLVSWNVGSDPARLTDPDLIALLAKARPALVGLNCSGGPQSLSEPLLALARALERAGLEIPLGAWPNAGVPGPGGTYPVTPEQLAAWFQTTLQTLAPLAPLALIGGCCGASPAHIAALAKIIGADE